MQSVGGPFDGNPGLQSAGPEAKPQARGELSAVVRWAIPFAAVGLAHLSNAAIPNGVFAAPFFITAVMISAHLADPRQALLAFLLAGATLDYFDVPPVGSFSIRPDLLPSLLQFIVPCALGVWFIRTRKRPRVAVGTRNGGRKALTRRAVLDRGRKIAPRISGRGARVTHRRVLHGGARRNRRPPGRLCLRPRDRTRSDPGGTRNHRTSDSRRSLAEDVAAARRAIDEQPGDVVLVGHSYGGAVITEAGNDPKVKSLVYVAAFGPDANESINDLGRGKPAPAWASSLRVDKGGFGWLPVSTMIHDFAQDLPETEASLLAVKQGSINMKSFDEKIKTAAWHSRPVWYVRTSQDHMIDPEAQTAMAKRLRATLTSIPTSHVAMLAQPQEVAAVITKAAAALHPVIAQH